MKLAYEKLCWHLVIEDDCNYKLDSLLALTHMKCEIRRVWSVSDLRFNQAVGRTLVVV